MNGFECVDIAYYQDCFISYAASQTYDMKGNKLWYLCKSWCIKFTTSVLCVLSQGTTYFGLILSN